LQYSYFQALILSTVYLDNFNMMLDISFTHIFSHKIGSTYHLDNNNHLSSVGCCQDNLFQMCRLVDNNWYSHGVQSCLRTSQLEKNTWYIEHQCNFSFHTGEPLSQMNSCAVLLV